MLARSGGRIEHAYMSDILVSFDFPPMIGGAHKWLYEIYSRWPAEVRVLTKEYSKDPQESSEQRAFDRQSHSLLRISRRACVLPRFEAVSLRYAFFLWKQVAAVKKLAGGVKGQDSERVTIHVLRAVPEGIPAWLYCKMHRSRTRLVTFVHGEEVLVSQTSRQLRFLARRVYEDSDLVIANSENTRKILGKAFPNVKSVCIHPGVDSRAFWADQRRRENYRRRLGWPEDTVIVLTLARMEARKNHAMVIRAVAKLRSEKMSVALICGGDGPERAHLVDLANNIGVSEWVRFVGAVSEQEKPELYAAADIFAMPSVTAGQMIEGFGIVFLEAAAAGLPTVCGNTGGQREAIWDGKSGYAVDGRSLEAVSQAIGRLVADPEMRHQFGDAGRKLAAEHDWDILQRKVWVEIEHCSV